MNGTSLTLSAGQQALLRQEMKRNSNVHVYRRAAALLAIHEGTPVAQVALLLGVTRQSIYNWIATYGGAGEQLDLTDGKRSGRPSRWNEKMQAALQAALQQTPAHFGYAARQWTVALLQGHLAVYSDRGISAETLRRRLQAAGYTWRRDRYVLKPVVPTVPAMTRSLAPEPPSLNYNGGAVFA